jgi:hypothetical protein
VTAALEECDKVLSTKRLTSEEHRRTKEKVAELKRLVETSDAMLERVNRTEIALRKKNVPRTVSSSCVEPIDGRLI